MFNSNQQRGGRRQPFGFLHANTLSATKAKCSVAATGNGTGDGATAPGLSFDPVKNESKKKFRGVLSSIVAKRKAGKNNARSSSSRSSSLEEYLVESRRRTEEDQNLYADATSDAAAGLGDFAAGDGSIFRKSGLWDDDMEDMLTLKLANPVSDDWADVEECAHEKETIDPSKSLARELDEHASGEPISSHSRLEYGECGFQIHIDR